MKRFPYTAGKQRIDLNTDRMLVLSLLRSVEIIGEAASRVSSDFQKQYPEVPWNQIIAMRNRLVHAYFDVDLDQVWDTVREDIPPLVIHLEKIVEKGSDPF